MINCVVLNFGYVESSLPCFVPFVSYREFETGEQAIRSLAKDLYLEYRNEHGGRYGKCCIESIDKGFRFCSACGKNLSARPGFNFEAFNDFVSIIYRYTADELCNFEMIGWYNEGLSITTLEAFKNETFVQVGTDDFPRPFISYLHPDDILPEDLDNYDWFLNEKMEQD